MLITDGTAKMSTAHLYLRLIHNSLQMNEYIINVMKRFFKNNLTSVSKGTIVTGQGFCSNLSTKNISLISWYKANIIWWKDQPNARTSILCCYSILVSSSAGGSTPGSECRRDFIAMHSLALAVHWDIISSFYDVTSFAGQILIQGVIQDRKVELTSLQCTALHLLAIVMHLHVHIVHVLALGVLWHHFER